MRHSLEHFPLIGGFHGRQNAVQFGLRQVGVGCFLPDSTVEPVRIGGHSELAPDLIDAERPAADHLPHGTIAIVNGCHYYNSLVVNIRACCIGRINLGYKAFLF